MPIDLVHKDNVPSTDTFPLITDYFGISDVRLSIPSHVNINGVEQYLKLALSDQEQELFKQSANTLKKIIKIIVT
jgi:malate/lactate dehydrogenase